MNNTLEFDENNNLSNKELNNETSKDRKKRRSKNDPNGRSYLCKHCNKTYLSEIALNSHIKTKHASLVEISGRGRGRPRKSGQPGSTAQQPAENRFKNFFDSSLRQKTGDFDLLSAAKENFDNIYTKYKDKLFKDVPDKDEFVFIGCAKEGTCDFSFWKYVEYCKERVNRDYFDFVFKFVVLFRECVNLKKGSEYSQKESAEVVPDMCNDFIADFMELHDYFGLDMNELIELIQHCCFWLWENHHTTSRLSLVN
jgi:hypothetical protein